MRSTRHGLIVSVMKNLAGHPFVAAAIGAATFALPVGALYVYSAEHAAQAATSAPPAVATATPAPTQNSAHASAAPVVPAAALPDFRGLVQTYGPAVVNVSGSNFLRTFDLLRHFTRTRFCVNENVTLIRLLELGLGFGVLPKEIADPMVKEGKLVRLNQGRTYKIPFALAWYPRSEMPDYFRAVVKMIT